MLIFQDVLILSQFLRDDGCMLPKRATGLCDKAQKNLSRLVWKAQRAGMTHDDSSVVVQV